MKKRALLHSLFFFLLTLLILVFYLLLVVFTGLVDINRCRREISDTRLRIADQTRTQNTIIFPDRRERELFKQARRKFRSIVPGAENREKLNSLRREIYRFVRASAKSGGIKRLLIENSDSGPILQEGSLSAGERQLFTRLRQDAARESVSQSFHPVDRELYGTLFSQVKSEKMILGFSGEIDQATSLISGLSGSDFLLRAENIRIAAGSGRPFFLIVLRFFFRDEIKKTVSPGQAKEKQPSVSPSPDYFGNGNDVIDFNSPLLLVPVYRIPAAVQKKRMLPLIAGHKIFILKRR
jgi:hypothetical protein